MSKERLEEIINNIPYSIRHEGNAEKLIEYAKEQAERVHELEKRLKIYQKRSWFEDYEKVAKQNKRYREALEFYAEGNHIAYKLDEIDDDLIIDYGEVARKELEGEE